MEKISSGVPVHFLDYENSWNLLTEKEKNYSYHFFKASWDGALILPFQISYEGPALFALFQNYFKHENYWQLKEHALKVVTEEEYKSFLAYAATFYANLGTYNSFGHNKFIPEIEPEKFWEIFRTNPEFE